MAQNNNEYHQTTRCLIESTLNYKSEVIKSALVQVEQYDDSFPLFKVLSHCKGKNTQINSNLRKYMQHHLLALAILHTLQLLIKINQDKT